MHIGIGPVIAIGWWLHIPAGIAIPIALFITIGLLINYKINLIPAIEDVERKSIGTILYGASITILLMLYWPKYEGGVTAGILSMAFGDGAAGLIGPQIYSPKWKLLGQTKSIAGTLAMAIIVSITLTSICLASGINLEVSKIIVLTISAIILEQFSPWGIDNITVPVGISTIWVFLIGS